MRKSARLGWAAFSWAILVSSVCMKQWWVVPFQVGLVVFWTIEARRQ
jgi:hypothetical protein